MFEGRLLGEASVRELRLALVVATTELEAERVSGVDAAGLVEDFARLEAIAHGGLVLVAERAAASGAWRDGGHRSPAHWLASVAGVTLGLAQRILGTSGRMASQPRTREAARRGDLPRDTVHDVSEAAEADPGAENELVDTAQRDSVRSTRDRCKQTKANALSDAERARQARRNRFVRRRSHPDGSAGFEYQAPGVDAAEVLAAIEHFQREIFERARRAGERTDSFENHAADALLAIARAAMAPPAPPEPPEAPGGSGESEPPDESGEAGGSGGSGGAGGNRRARRARARRGGRGGRRAVRPTVLVRVDHAALVRGAAEGGEVCEIAGVGPVPVAMVRELLDDALVRVVVTKGVDVVSVAHHGRAPNAHQRSALAWMHSRCSVQGCDNAVFIEVDHRTPWRDDPVTAFANLDPLCSHHHYLKERGWHLAPGTGRRPMLPPDIPTPTTRHNGAPTTPKPFHRARQPRAPDPAEPTADDQPSHRTSQRSTDSDGSVAPSGDRRARAPADARLF